MMRALLSTTSDSPSPPWEPGPTPRAAGAKVDPILIWLGIILTFCIYGYRFGEGNHTIYLLDGLRRTNPQLLKNDWFVTQTLQYHAFFGWLSHKLLEWRAIEPVFLGGYVLLIAMFHTAWLGIVRRFGGGGADYLLSLVLYYVSAAGTGLGMYQFFQDSSFLPSNVANVAMLWAVYLWLSRRFAWSGACLGVAGLFHLNHAVVGSLMWVALCGGELLGSRKRLNLPPAGSGSWRAGALLGGSLLALAPSAINIAMAAQVKLQQTAVLPLEEFVNLYVRFRHPHHYDPSSWPVALWVSFLWPLPLALRVVWRRKDEPARRGRQLIMFFLSLQGVALLGAGIWYVSEALVQLSLYRFSILVQLLACIMVAQALVRALGTPRLVGAAAAAACAGMIGLGLLRGPFFGMFSMPGDDPEYLTVCDWSRLYTPRDAVFLVPPGESSFRLRAERAIIVNFKAVPQLSGELPQWRDRLRAVLALDDLSTLPRGYGHTIEALNRRYADLPEEHLAAVVRNYNARFVVSARRLGGMEQALRFSTATGRYFLYDLSAPKEERADER
jgi:hypothetical protein